MPSNIDAKTSLRVFFSWRMLEVLGAGFASGLPYSLTGSTMQGWMTSQGINVKMLGLFTLVALPYSFKFLWSPLMDRFIPPLLGRRRGWMLVMQLLLVVGILAMSQFSPKDNLLLVSILAFGVSFFSASQDIAVDAFRTETLRSNELGPGASVGVLGYRIGLIVSGAVALILADPTKGFNLSWHHVYLLMAACMAVSVLITLLAPEPKVNSKPPATLREAVVEPFGDFLRRRGAWEMLLFIFIFKLDVAMAQALPMPFFNDLKFDLGDIGAVNKGFGLIATIVGGLIGGAAMTRLGVYKSLWIFGLLQGLSGLSFTLLAIMGHNYPMMVTAIVVENACAGMGTTAYVAFIMSLCNKRFTATQFALLSSLMALAKAVVGPPAGWVAESCGWAWYYVIATLLAIPGLLLLLRYHKWQRVDDEAPLTVPPTLEVQVQATSKPTA